MRPSCPKCGGWLHHQPQTKFEIESLTCINCGWSVRRDKPALPARELAFKKIDTWPCMTIEKEARICNLRRYNGLSLDSIAEDVGVSRSIVARALYLNGITGGVSTRGRIYNFSQETA